MSSRNRTKPVPLLSLFAWSFSLSGVLTFLANILGMGGRSWVFPAVDNPAGLLLTSFLLFILGAVPFLLQRIRRSGAS